MELSDSPASDETHDSPLVIRIDGRDALPVRAIPYVSGWMLTPDVVAKHFAHDDGRGVQRLKHTKTYHVGAGRVVELLPKEWNRFVAALDALEAELNQEFSDKARGYAAWIRRSPAKLPPGVFVWLDEFVADFERDHSKERLNWMDERVGDRELKLNPFMEAEDLVMVLDGFGSKAKLLNPLTDSNQKSALVPAINKVNIDWSFWCGLDDVSVFEAISLLLNEAPLEGPPAADEMSAEHRKMRRLLLNNLSDRTYFSPGPLSMQDASLHGVKLREVGDWALARGIRLPDRFPRTPQMSKAPSPIAPLRGATAMHANVPLPAEWGKWAHIPTCELWEAVCLTLDIEPPEDKHAFYSWLQSRRHLPPGFTQPFADRVRIAESNLSKDGPIRPQGESAWAPPSALCQVLVSEVAAAAIAWDWSLPDAMRALAHTAVAAVNPEPIAVAKVLATTSRVTHSTKKRRDSLTPVIELAQKGCTNPSDAAEVWAALQVLAEKKSPPLLGATDEGLQYLSEGTAKIFKRESLRKRVSR